MHSTQDTTIVPGTEVRVGPEPVYHNWRGRPVRGPRSLAGRTAVVTGEPDRDGDVPLTIDGKFYPEQLSPACLTVVREPQPVSKPTGTGWPLRERNAA